MDASKGKQFASRGKRKDVEYSSVKGLWGMDQIGGKDPDFEYQFMRTDEVRDRSYPRQVVDRKSGETKMVRPWQVCKYSEDMLNVLGEGRADVGAPVDDVFRQGPHVLMRIPKADYDLLQHEKEATTDHFEERLLRGHKTNFNSDPNTFFEEKPSPIIRQGGDELP